MVVDRGDLAHARAGGELVAVFAPDRAGGHIDEDDPQQLVAGADCRILNQGCLHDADECLAVRRDRQTFHAFVGDPPAGVARDLGRTDRVLIRHIIFGGQLEGLDQHTGRAVELAYVGAIFVGDEHRAAIGRDPDALGVEASIQGIARVRAAEVVGSAGEIEGTRRVTGRCAGAKVQACTAAIDQRLRTRQQGGLGDDRHEGHRQRRPTAAWRKRHVHRLKAADVADGVVDRSVVRRGIRPPIRGGEEGVAASPGHARPHAAEHIAGKAVFKRRGQSGEIARAVESADGQQPGRGLSTRCKHCRHTQ